MYYRNNCVSFVNQVLYRLKILISYYYFTWISYKLDAYETLSTRLLFHLGLMSQVADKVIPPVFIYSSSYDFV